MADMTRVPAPDHFKGDRQQAETWWFLADNYLKGNGITFGKN